ncbi:hypothetical protein P167DRAFT_575956 [Morchella conica CCBAS932]|uniref:Uncharacterized protein n=1 Tax=Morchella conica CCBAS932 TaxID=1392247 RepID=A0A3N4KN78_9PEZI|nr:hypothetical protein P167DRAFT_575956 [Morchella conica CCBAS932]
MSLSIRASFSEVVSGTGYTSGSVGAPSAERSSQNTLMSLDSESTDPNNTRALQNGNLGQFDVELRTLIEKAVWQVTKDSERLFTNLMLSVLELAWMVRNSWDFSRAGTDFPAELLTSVAGQMEKAKGVIVSYYGLAGMTGEQAKARVDYLLTDDQFNCNRDHHDPVQWHFTASQIPITALAAESRKAIIDSGVGSFLAGLQAKLSTEINDDSEFDELDNQQFDDDY